MMIRKLNYHEPKELLFSHACFCTSLKHKWISIGSKHLKTLRRDSNVAKFVLYKTVPLTSFKIKGQWREGMNVLGLVMFSVVLGATIGKMRERGKPILDFLVSLSEAMMIITRWVIWLVHMPRIKEILSSLLLTQLSLLLGFHRLEFSSSSARRF